ncbi:MAG: hypothetical protein JO257_00415, partial [Deltaproteobacteria bacterium]|nr:hypothetical protein [Deltaproteobacteria bacterium]
MRALLLLCLLASTAHAQDEFEIQVYFAETAHQGEPGLELHLNHHLIDGAANQTHTTFEPHYGLREWLELGGYLQASETRGSRPEFAGAKLRLMARVPHRYWNERIGLAINGELSIVPSQFEANVYGSEIRPIADFREGRIYGAINPIITMDLGGDLAGHPQLEPCAKLAYLVNGSVSIGVEGYGAFGPIDDLGREEVERGFVTLDYKGR